MTGLGCRSLLCLAIIMFLGAGPARSEDVETGKAGSMLFASNCAMCHGSPHGVPKRTNGWPLTERKHYTASETSAHRLAAYLLAGSGNSRRNKQQPIANMAQQGTGDGWILPPRPSAAPTP
jgi:mono/diheme cytochrome c family protein